MAKVIMGIQLEQRRATVNSIQSLLSEYGCFIRTRLGVHEASDEFCSESGLILLEFVSGKQDAAKELETKLRMIPHVSVKTMEF